MSLGRLKVLTPYVGDEKIDDLMEDIGNLFDVLTQYADGEITPEFIRDHSTFSLDDIDVKRGVYRKKVWLRVYPNTDSCHYGAEDFYFWVRVSRLRERLRVLLRREGSEFKVNRVQFTWKDED